MKKVIVESPFASPIEQKLLTNIAYAKRAMRDCLDKGEAPIASHLIYPGILDDNKPEERQLGIDAGLAWRLVADLRVFYTDLGWSKGMIAAKELYDREGLSYELRSIENT